MYNEDEFLQLSGIQHFAFCRRQWALAYIEMQWQENVRTVEGKILHENAHDASLREKRGDLLIVRVNGSENNVGVSLDGRDGSYAVVPVEYKRGKPKENDVDILQVTAQALCLEEMLCCIIPYGYIYYGETRHRMKVVFTDEIKGKVKSMFTEMHKYYDQQYTPKVKISRKCNACSLKDICLPVLNKKKSVSGYIEKILAEEEET